MSNPPCNRLTWQMWLSLLALGLVLWVTITYNNIILEVSYTLFGATLLALALRPVTDRLHRRHVPRGLTVLGVYVLIGLFLAAVGNLLAPVIGAEIRALRTDGPTLFQGAWNQLMSSPLAGWIPTADTVAQSVTQRLNTLLVGAVGTVAGVSNLTLDLTVVLILTYFFTTNTDWNSTLILDWLPTARRSRAQRILIDVRRRLTRWLWAQLGVALYFTLTFSAGLALLGVPYALSLGVVSGLLGIVPYLGTFIAILLAVLSALTVGPLLALWVAVFTLLASSIEIHVIAPLLCGQAMGLPSAVILIALLVGAKAQGITGVIFAVPLAVILAAIAQEARMVQAAAPVEPEPTQDEQRDSGGTPARGSQ